ncbi:MAG: hypothetical protein ABIQ30_00660, partial [Devosia sp.]
ADPRQQAVTPLFVSPRRCCRPDKVSSFRRDFPGTFGLRINAIGTMLAARVPATRTRVLHAAGGH